MTVELMETRKVVMIMENVEYTRDQAVAEIVCRIERKVKQAYEDFLNKKYIEARTTEEKREVLAMDLPDVTSIARNEGNKFLTEVLNLKRYYVVGYAYSGHKLFTWFNERERIGQEAISVDKSDSFCSDLKALGYIQMEDRYEQEKNKFKGFRDD
jgi:Icc-related predicted phosphoesterase